MSEVIATITDQNFEAEALGSKIPVLLDFWAEWCQPCLAMVPDLESVSLSGPAITNEWAVSIGKLPQMGYLILTATAIDDAGLPPLLPLPLTYLRLSGAANITDASIPLLKTFSKLNNVVTDGTGITPAGRTELDQFYRSR